MNMHVLDWSIVAGLLVLLVFAAFYTRRYNRSVADFLVANRCAGRYLICVSHGIAGIGAISIVAMFQMYYNAGFTAAWWQLIQIVVVVVIAMSGWVIYRFRQTRAMTLAQLLEIRYSRKLRIFTGILAWVSGIINFGIFPAVGGRFFIYFCGLPESFGVMGVQVSMLAVVIFVLLVVALFFTFMGGQVAVIVTDFIQGTLCNIMFVIIALAVLIMFSWPEILEALQSAEKEVSLLHPFHTKEAEDFNIFFYLIGAFFSFYCCMIWQGSQGYNASAKSPHEARMGQILGTWRVIGQSLFMMLLPVCVYVFMHHANYEANAAAVRESLAGIENPQIRDQMTTPLAMARFLPVGLMGGMCAVMLAAFISTHDTYLHSWGSIFIQDVVMPFRKKTFSTKQHMLLLRISIFGVAVFVFIFSMLFRQTDYILMFFQITGAIFMSGAGAVVIGGLYWKYGTTAAAWSAMITGSTLAVSGVIIQQINETSPFEGAVMSKIASLNGVIMAFYASLIAIGIYVIVSLTGKRRKFNMDRMLHRGKYVVAEDHSVVEQAPVRGFRALLGMNNEFTLKDKILYILTTFWTLAWMLIFIGGTIYNAVFDVTESAWAKFWYGYVWFTLVLSILIVAWFLVGGLLDLKEMFNLLRNVKRDNLDDGMVLNNKTDEPAA